MVVSRAGLLRVYFFEPLAVMLSVIPIVAQAQTPGPPPVPLGAPMTRDLGAAGVPRPPLPGFAGQDDARRPDGESGRPTSTETETSTKPQITGEKME